MDKEDGAGTFRLRYTVEAGHFGSDDIGPGQFLADAMIVGVTVYSRDGCPAPGFQSFDGVRSGRPMTDAKLFETWVLLADILAKSTRLPDGKKAYANEVFNDWLPTLALRRDL